MSQEYVVSKKSEHYHRIVILKEGIDPKEWKARREATGFMVFPLQKKHPSINVMHRWLDNGIARATDGCKVEPDGCCQHGHPSWLLALRYI